MRRVLSQPLLFSALIHGYIGVRLIPALWGDFGLSIAIAALLLASFALVPNALRASRQASPSAWSVWPGLILMGITSALFALTICRDLVLLLVKVTGHYDAAVARWTALSVVSLSAVLAVLGVLYARFGVRIAHVRAPLANLPMGLLDLRIVQISDLHVGATIRGDFVSRIVERINRLRPDIIAITGDLVDGSVPALRTHTAPLSRLSARYGTFFVTGNHEYYSGEPAWTHELRRLGLTVLKNEHVLIEHGGETLVLAGVNDASASHFSPAEASNAHAAVQGAPADAAARILLAHQPRSAQEAARAGFDLQLSGHTHGGQFWPWSWIVRWFEPFVAGLSRVGDLLLYVSRGTGYWGPPMRFGSRPEISLIQLVSR